MSYASDLGELVTVCKVAPMSVEATALVAQLNGVFEQREQELELVCLGRDPRTWLDLQEWLVCLTGHALHRHRQI